MLPAANQLKKKKDFEKVFKKGKGYKEGFLYLKTADNNLQASRFGFVTSKKFSPKAVIRNKTKRWLRESAKVNLLNIKNGIDIVVVVMPGFKADSFLELETTLRSLFKKAGVIK